MGWCGQPTDIFDDVYAQLVEDDSISYEAAKAVLVVLAKRLEDGDWDCQSDSVYWDDDLCQDVFETCWPERYSQEDVNF